MDGKPNININPKITGSLLVGVALVAGAYVFTNFGQTKPVEQQVAVESKEPVLRTAIDVSDEDQNGIEDWKDEFVSSATVVVDSSAEEYTPPETLTGQIGISVTEDIIQSKTDNIFGLTNEEVIEKNTQALLKTVELEPFGSSDINIMEEWDDDDIVNYANTVATVVITYNNPEAEYELDILRSVMEDGQTDRLSEIADLAGAYTNYYTDTLKIPVPSILAKEHLDLINTYKAVAEDLEGMVMAFEDPMVTFLHLTRYQDDALALAYALENMYTALEPHADLFTVEDPALMFVAFSPEYMEYFVDNGY